MVTKEDITAFLREVVHPAMGDRNIVELGMLDSIDFDGNKVTVTLAFGKKRDPLAEYLIGSTRASLVRNLPDGFTGEVKTTVKEAAQPEKKRGGIESLGTGQLKDVKHIIGIASGKGGVGKSTVAVNLACALARLGYRVGLADADVYGPSVPTMTATEGVQPDAENIDGTDIIVPIEKYGVKWMSIGYFAQRGQALIWRGPMACNALKQMILQVKWGQLDYLLIDMPPGTGDIHISLVQDIPMEGAVIVTTPQNVALADVEKGADLFRNKGVGKPVFGIIENMSWFTPLEHPDEKYFIFGKDGGKDIASGLGVGLLAQIPLVQGIRENADDGEPSALGSGPAAEAFLDLAAKLAGILN